MAAESLSFDVFWNDRGASSGMRNLAQAASEASGDVKSLADKLDKVAGKSATARVGLEGNKEAIAQLDQLDVKLIRLGNKVANPSIGMEGKAKALADISAVDLAMDKLNKKYAKVDVSVNKGGGFLSKILGFLGGAGGGAAGGAASAAGNAGGGGGGGGAAALANPWAIAGIGALATAPLGLLDALIGQGVGTGVAGVGALGAYKYDKSQITPGLQSITQAIRPVFQSIGPSIGLMIAQLGQFLHGERNPLAQLFSSSLPFIQQFIKVLEQVTKTLLPSFTQVMREFVQTGSLKEMTQGFVYLTQGVAELIKELGPGFKAGAETFRAITIVIRDALIALGQVFGGLGGAATHAFGAIHDGWDAFRHAMASGFDDFRHYTAHVWTMTWNDTAVAFYRIAGQIIDNLHNWLFDIVGEFGKLPGQIGNVLSHLGGELESVGRSAIDSMLRGMESVAGSLLGWVKNFVSNIWGDVKSFFGFGSPSRLFYTAGKNIVLGMERGIQDHAHRAVSAAHRMAAAVGGHVTGSAAQAQAYARRLAAGYGWTGQWADINAVAMRESGWSLTARNPTSGAYGIAQFIQGPPEYYQYGGNPNTVSGQVTAFFNYIRQRYGSPAAAWQHEESYGWYGSGLSGGIFSRPTLIGVGERGPERVDVTPLSRPMVLPRNGSGATVVLEVHGGSDVFDQFMLTWLRKAVRVRGGNVQVVLGRN